MTKHVPGAELAEAVERSVPGSVAEVQPQGVVIQAESIRAVAAFLRDDPGFAFDFLASLTAVDYLDYFEVVYHLTSLTHNHSAVLKTRAYGRSAPAVPSVVAVWRGADFQEREAWDLMGVRFEGHPDLKRILMYEPFEGHPLRKDFLEFDHRTLAASAEAAVEDR
ncbi:MAG: NADH-quinone oxidoreductase subunit C [Chloroflexota bacterium]